MWLAFLGLAAAATTATPPIGAAIDEVAGVNNLNVLLRHSLGTLAVAAVLEFVMAMARPQLVRPFRPYNIAGSLAVSAIMTTLFANLDQPTRVENFFVAYEAEPVALIYALVFMVYLAVAMVLAMWMCLSAARKASRSWLRSGLYLLGIGTGLGAVYALMRDIHLSWLLTNASFPMSQTRFQFLADLVQYTAIFFILVGNAIAPIDALRTSLADWRALRKLRPLWKDVTGAVPDVVLPVPLGHGPRIRLHRMVIEIRDAASILAAHIGVDEMDQARTRAEQAGHLPAEYELAAQGHCLHAAARARRSGLPASATPSAPTATATDAAGELDFKDEVRRLLVLAAAHRQAHLSLTKQGTSS